MRLFYRVAVLFAAGVTAWAAKTEVLFFVSTDCPISNSFAPEIQRICKDYAAKGVGCSLVYEDVQVDEAAVRKHLAEYGYNQIPAIIDADRHIADKNHATITPQAVVIDSADKIRYRGRINNFYAALGKPRQVITVNDVRDALDAVLAGKTVSHPETTAFGCYIVPPDILKEQK
jgi:thiol-disulfide isomerase/thioredoxin